MFYLSFDCANKSLGVSFFEFNDQYKLSLINLYNKFSLIKDNSNQLNHKNIIDHIVLLKATLKKQNNFSLYFSFLKELNNILDSVFNIQFLNVVNLLQDKKTKDVSVLERSICLKNKLKEIDELVFKDKKNMIVCIEYQMNCNDKSRTIYNQLIYNYSCIENVEVKIIAPAYKNKVYLNKDLKHNKFIQQYKNNYIANKKHTAANLLYFAEVFGIDITHIKKKNIDDLADSFLQALYIIYK